MSIEEPDLGDAAIENLLQQVLEVLQTRSARLDRAILSLTAIRKELRSITDGVDPVPTCEICGKTSTTKQGIALHKRRSHSS